MRHELRISEVPRKLGLGCQCMMLLPLPKKDAISQFAVFARLYKALSKVGETLKLSH